MPVRPWMVRMALSPAFLLRLRAAISNASSPELQHLVQSRGFASNFVARPRSARSLVQAPGAANAKACDPDVWQRVEFRGLCGGLWSNLSQNGVQQSRLDSGRSDVRRLVQSRRFSGRSGLIAMANVTKKNFAQALEQLRGQLQFADFVAVDLEMTGVDSTMWRRNLELDSCETRYQNLKHSAEKFAVWQCGVCPFKWDQANNKFVAYPHNFFIFPRNELQLEIPSRGFFVQTTSLEFLAKHRFDFNACVHEGISYLSHEQEAAARAQLGLAPGAPQKKQSSAEEAEIPLTRSGDIVFVEKIRLQIGNWRDELLRTRQKWQWTEKSGPTVGNTQSSSLPAAEPTTAEDLIIKEDIAVGPALGSLRPSLSLNVMSSHQARLVKQVLRKHYHDLVGVAKENGGGGSNPSDRSHIHVIYTTSKEDKLQLLQELADEERRALEARVAVAVGFRKVVDAIRDSGLPVVGHNCILDMAHIHSKFLSPLPPSIAQFSSSLLQRFPCIVDTKYLLRAEPTLRGVLSNRSTSLAIVFSHICQGFADRAVASGRFYFGKNKILNTSFSKVKVEVAEDFRRYGGAKDTEFLKHEAGFDAYMTGAVFAQACHLLQIDAATIRSLPDAVKAGEQGLASYANLLALGWVGNMALDLTTGQEATGVKALRGRQPPANRHSKYDVVTLVWGFPRGCKEPEIQRLVQRVFNWESHFPSIDITVVDESSAFVHFKDPRLTRQFLQLMHKLANEPWDAASPPPSFRAAPYEAYELLCKSPLTTECLADSANILRFDQFLLRESLVDPNPTPETAKHERAGGAAPAPEPDEAAAEPPKEKGIPIGLGVVEIGVAGPEHAAESIDITRKDFSPAALGLNYSSWMKRSFSEEESQQQQQTLGGPDSTKRPRSREPGDGDDS